MRLASDSHRCRAHRATERCRGSARPPRASTVTRARSRHGVSATTATAPGHIPRPEPAAGDQHIPEQRPAPGISMPWQMRARGGTPRARARRRPAAPAAFRPVSTRFLAARARGPRACASAAQRPGDALRAGELSELLRRGREQQRAQGGWPRPERERGQHDHQRDHADPPRHRASPTCRQGTLAPRSRQTTSAR